MFDYDSTLEILESFDKMKSGKAQKMLRRLFEDETFFEWLFAPKPVPNIDQMMNGLYSRFTKPRVVREILEMLEDSDYEDFTRSNATFIYSICNLGIKSNNDRILEINQKRKSGEISGKEADSLNEKVIKYNEYIAELLKYAKRIVKKDAKEMSAESNVPKHLCITALHSAPEPKYIDRYKIGYYLNNLLNNLYSEVESCGTDLSDARWKVFFKYIFGKENVIEVATFILLEGVRRIDNYKNSAAVKVCWDALTTFALRELNDAPDALRTQMIELYIKRISKMFANKAYDLRVDMRSINGVSFPRLSETISKYASRIDEILNKGRTA